MQMHSVLDSHYGLCRGILHKGPGSSGSGHLARVWIEVGGLSLLRSAIAKPCIGAEARGYGAMLTDCPAMWLNVLLRPLNGAPPFG